MSAQIAVVENNSDGSGRSENQRKTPVDSTPMRALVTAVIAAIEAMAIALAGLIILVSIALLLWAVTFHLAPEPGEAIVASFAVWLLAHGVPLTLHTSAAQLNALDVSGGDAAWTLSLVPLGLTLGTLILAGRSGWRFAGRGGIGVAGVIGGTLGFAAAAELVLLIAQPVITWPHPRVIVAVALCFLLPSVLMFLVRAMRDEHDWWEYVTRALLRAAARFNHAAAAAIPSILHEVFRVTAMLLCAVLGIAAAGLTVSLFAGYAEFAAISQGLHLDAMGIVMMWLLQLAMLPTALLWSVAWFSGAGFAVGSGTSVTPGETLLGPMPAFPLFAAMPQGWGGLSFLAPGLIILAALGVGVLFARTDTARRLSWPVALGTVAAAALMCAVAIVVLTSWATGSIGPGRLSVTGPDPWHTAWLLCAQLGGGVLLGTAAGKADYARMLAAVPEMTAASDGLRNVAERGASLLGNREWSNPFRAREVRRADVSTDPSTRTSAAPSVHASAPTDAETVDLSDVSPLPRLRSELADAAQPTPDTEAADPLLRAFSWESAENEWRDRAPDRDRPTPGIRKRIRTDTGLGTDTGAAE